MNSEEQNEWVGEQLRIAAQVKVFPDNHAPQSRFSRLLLPDNGVTDAMKKQAFVGGVDVSYSLTTNEAIAVYVILEVPSFEVVFVDSEMFEVEQTYIPSFLAFREIGPLRRLIEKQTTNHPQWTPLVILVDGNGTFHNRGAGLACALGVTTGLPTIGIGKTLYQIDNLTKDVVWRGIDKSLKDATRNLSLVEKEDDNQKNGDDSDFWIRDNEWISGEPKQQEEPFESLSPTERRQMVEKLVSLSMRCSDSTKPTSRLRGLAIPLHVPSRGILACAVLAHGQRRQPTQTPIFVSVGHLISLEQATQWVVAMSVFSRIPEPVRQADLRGRALLRVKEGLKA
ncbi:deoxyribonuclease V [Fistulifera solaris]|jgi:deoxyinosine 3'endonuclease (endonuclease V)|uniref:Deoxyribonuclease V n=1 Tax=Fistulifera solaris TaxID=1519565 RepID=A0A1Z5KB25_FISSO|nr:deoxyribonuclease V [Fistulifera solaris]|eukprot:GAX23464.1 deoxyribonuclease V [Fistulifera solaris]